MTNEHLAAIKIRKHPRGIVIQAQSSNSYGLSGVVLRARSRAPISSLPGNAYLIPIQYAYTLLGIIEPDMADWDQEIWDLANRQSSRREAQLRSSAEVDYAIDNASELLSGYELLSTLDRHQVEAVAAISVPSLQGIALFDEQGTGKTISALCGFDWLHRQGTVERLIVIAPKSVLGSWQSDIKTLFANHYKVLTLDGSASQRYRKLLLPHDIIIVSYETVTSELPRLEMIVQSKRYMLVVDESYYVKNPSARRTKAVIRLRDVCRRAVVLCGTPAPNSPIDVVQQIDIADQGVAFRGVNIPADIEDAKEVIEEALGKAVYLRRLKQDVFPNIPIKNVERDYFELEQNQQRLYEQSKDNLVLELRRIDDLQFAKDLTSYMGRRTTLLQICSHPGGVDPLYASVPAKHSVLDKLLHELIDDNGKKVVLWSYFRYSLQALVDRYSRYGVARIDGTTSSVEERIAAIRAFQQDPKTKLFIGNPAAAGAGITLTSAHHAIYESFSNQAAHYMQSVDRIHRRGQEQDVTYHVLLAQKTVEGAEFERILEKERTSRDLLGDHYEEPMTRERFLAELVSTYS